MVLMFYNFKNCDPRADGFNFFTVRIHIDLFLCMALIIVIFCGIAIAVISGEVADEYG